MLQSGAMSRSGAPSEKVKRFIPESRIRLKDISAKLMGTIVEHLCPERFSRLTIKPLLDEDAAVAHKLFYFAVQELPETKIFDHTEEFLNQYKVRYESLGRRLNSLVTSDGQ
eukprot:7478425-Lingulodinium_polyedra.AAC.1